MKMKLKILDIYLQNLSEIGINMGYYNIQYSSNPHKHTNTFDADKKKKAQSQTQTHLIIKKNESKDKNSLLIYKTQFYSSIQSQFIC